jgi:hypothetical protein
MRAPAERAQATVRARGGAGRGGPAAGRPLGTRGLAACHALRRRPSACPRAAPPYKGFGAAATGGSRRASVAKLRCTRAGVSWAGGRGRSQGRRQSATAPRARRSWVEAARTSQVQRSAGSGRRTRGVTHRRTCVRNLTVCSRSALRQYPRHRRSRSSGEGRRGSSPGSGGGCHHSQTTSGVRRRPGRRPPSRRTTVPWAKRRGPR